MLCDLGQLISPLWASVSGLPVWIVIGLYPIILVPVIYFFKKPVCRKESWPRPA